MAHATGQLTQIGLQLGRPWHGIMATWTSVTLRMEFAHAYMDLGHDV